MRGEESGKGRSGSALSGQHVPYQLPRRRVPTRMGRFRPAAGNRERQSGDGEALSAAQTSAPNALPAGVHKAGRTRKGGARLLRAGNGTSFVLLRVKPTEPPEFKRNLDASFCRDRFRTALQRS